MASAPSFSRQPSAPLLLGREDVLVDRSRVFVFFVVDVFEGSRLQLRRILFLRFLIPCAQRCSSASIDSGAQGSIVADFDRHDGPLAPIPIADAMAHLLKSST